MTGPNMDIRTIACFVLLSSFIVSNEAYNFFHGRPKGGFLGSPGEDTELGPAAAPPPAQWFSQKLNHSNTGDTRHFNQRYFVNSTFYTPGGPLFIMIGGESALTGGWVVNGAWINYAATYRAYCVELEHRFYGMSRPFVDLSTDNLQYLTTEQALADLAAFITYLKGRFTFSKVIAFGGSYAGSLAAWLRLKYPHTVDGAVASSAPVNTVVNFKEYLEVVDSSFRYFYPSGSCNSAITAATNSFSSSLTTLAGRQNLKSLFKLCEDIDPTNQKDIQNLYSKLAHNFKQIVQYNNDRIVSDTSNININQLCGIMTNQSMGDVLHRYAQVNTLLLNAHKESCLSFQYSRLVSHYNQVSWNSSAAEGGRQWLYQTCTELGYFQSSESKNQPFGNEFPINFWTQQCADIFGPKFSLSSITAGVQRSVVDYGGLGIKTSRVIFPNGSIDPWHPLSVLQNLGPDVKAIYITGTAHCADMYTTGHLDPPQLTQARANISATIGVWLKS